MKQAVTIEAYKYSNKLHYEWQASIIKKTDTYAVVYCEAGRTFIHHSKQKSFVIPYPSLEWFYFDRGYTIAISFKPEGLMYYSNIAMPAQYNGQTISFVDLDLDYIKEPSEDWKVVDEEEFVLHQQQLSYPAELIEFAYQSLEQLKQTVKAKAYPFSLSEQELREMLKLSL